jgi:hypothetical protein
LILDRPEGYLMGAFLNRQFNPRVGIVNFYFQEEVIELTPVSKIFPERWSGSGTGYSDRPGTLGAPLAGLNPTWLQRRPLSETPIRVRRTASPRQPFHGCNIPSCSPDIMQLSGYHLLLFQVP